MCHVDHEDGIDAFGDGGDALKVDDACIRRCARDDHARMVLGSEFFEGIVVDALGLAVNAVGDDLVVGAGDVDGAAVREVSAVREVHAENRIARREKCKEHRHVRLCPRMRLDVRPRGAEQLLRAVDRKLFHDINVFAAAIVALAGVALGMFVRENAPLRLHDRAADDVLRGDKFELCPLTVELVINCLRDLRV